MFYSHEILTSHQYGVATIWLVATVGNRGGTKKVTRKAIQEVDVQKACGKILEPGAPIALRLQGNLLYGVSRVYNQQCSYMLTDAEKIRHHMNMFFKQFGGNHIDPEAGQARPENLLIGNDPDFIPDMQLPRFDLDALVASQGTQKTSSQMSPLQDSFLPGSTSPGRAFDFQLDLGHSDSSGPRGSPFGLQGLSSAQKPDDEPMLFTQEDEYDAAGGDWGLMIDEHGNVIEADDPVVVQDEPELPPLPHMEGEEHPQANVQHHEEQPILDEQGQPILDEQGDIIMMEEEPLPEVEAFPEAREPLEEDAPQVPPAQARRKRKARTIQADQATEIPRDVLRGWQDNYIDNCAIKPLRSVAPAHVKKTAMLLTFGRGIGNIGQRIGQDIGIPGASHPLFAMYSGDSLFTAITGMDIPEKPRGRRRSASEAIGDDEEQEERRVRPRLGVDEIEQQALNAADEHIIDNDPFAAENAMEVGREEERAMSEQHSSVMPMPWNRGSSLAPGSSIRKPGSAQKGRDISSPLGNRGSAQDIVRYSDDAPMGFGGEDDFALGGFGSQDSSFDGMAVPEVNELQTKAGEDNVAEQNERLRATLDNEGHNFLGFIEDAVRDNGERRQDDDFDINRKWVAFDDLFVPCDTPRAMAAQAFYHTLCLTTKAKLYVEQYDGERHDEPFGPIFIGSKISGGA
ncbi:Uu.00g113700.m01.CDS01 [Anthostomella pinea]|uniref:Uu.00g113700.m01.CDS01 n=1 Tax=Anthostomella pinea TaxID=933095 RepID=A0AAI8YGK9_9PEZI|nr:Uu.00g113700.m01.CDS01 [Anthostomella pinea]